MSAQRQNKDATAKGKAVDQRNAGQGRMDRETGQPGDRQSQRESTAGLPSRRSGAAAAATANGGGRKQLRGNAYALQVGVQMSIRYHDRRRSWFVGWNNGTLVGAVFFAGGVAARLEQVVNLPWLPWTLSVLTGASVALNLAYRFADHAAEHHLLAKRFRALHTKIDWRSMTQERYQDCRAERIAIEAEEPAGVKRLLSLLCEYESLKATRETALSDVKKMVSKIRWWRRALAPAWSQATFVMKNLRGIRPAPSN